MPAETVFILRRMNWQRTHAGWVRLPGETRLRSFDTLADADAECRRLEDAARLVANPFRCGGPSLHHQTHFDADRLHDWLMDAGLEPPTPGEDGRRDWVGWWKTHSATLTADQRSRVWEACDRVRFHDVIESPRRPTLHVLVEIGWYYNDQWNVAESEGGRAVRAYRDRGRAEAACAEANALARARNFSEDPFEVNERLASAEPFARPPAEHHWAEPDELRERDEAPFFEVVEIEWEGK